MTTFASAGPIRATGPQYDSAADFSVRLCLMPLLMG